MRKSKTKGKKVKAKPLPLEINVDEYVELLYAAKHMRHRVAFMLGFESGMRISEIVNLKKADIEVKNNQIRINMGKNSKDRIVPLPGSWQEHHINYIPMPCKQRALQKALVESAERNGLKAKKPKVHFHSLRHGFATQGLRTNLKLTEIQMLMGHEDPSTTSIYINLAPEEALRAYRNNFGRISN